MSYEDWWDAYARIKSEVEAEMPDATEADRYDEYRSRCQAWKRERGIK